MLTVRQKGHHQAASDIRASLLEGQIIAHEAQFEKRVAQMKAEHEARLKPAEFDQSWVRSSKIDCFPI